MTEEDGQRLSTVNLSKAADTFINLLNAGIFVLDTYLEMSKVFLS